MTSTRPTPNGSNNEPVGSLRAAADKILTGRLYDEDRVLATALAAWLKDSATLHVPDTECGYCIPARNPLKLQCPAREVARAVLGEVTIVEQAPPVVVPSAPADRAACVCREASAPNTVHRSDGPCYAVTPQLRVAALAIARTEAWKWADGERLEDQPLWQMYLGYADAVLAVLPATTDRDALELARGIARRLAAHAVGFQDVLDDTDRGPWARTVGTDITALCAVLDELTAPALPAPDDEMAASLRRDGFGDDEITDILSRPIEQPTADRATALSDTERQFLTFALDEAAEEMSLRDGFTDEDRAALEKLRRMADGTQQPEAQAADVSPTAALLSSRCDACRHTLNWHRNDVGCTVVLCVCGRFQPPVDDAQPEAAEGAQR